MKTKTKRSNVPIRAIAKMVDYLHHDEQLHYVAPDPTHIWHSVKAVAKWLETSPATVTTKRQPLPRGGID